MIKRGTKRKKTTNKERECENKGRTTKKGVNKNE